MNYNFFSFCSFNRRVEISVLATGKLLWEVKGGGQGQAISKAEVTQAADAILQPLMDLLDGRNEPFNEKNYPYKLPLHLFMKSNITNLVF